MKTARLALALAALLPLALAARPAEAATATSQQQQQQQQQQDGSGRQAQPTATPAPPAATPSDSDTRPAPAEPVAPVMPLTVVRPQPPAAAATPPPGTPRRLAVGAHGEVELGRPAGADSRWHGFPISLSLRDAPLDEVLRSFARLTGMNLVLQPGVRGSVTCELHDVPWDQALHVILKTQGLGAEIDGRVWTVERY